MDPARLCAVVVLVVGMVAVSPGGPRSTLPQEAPKAGAPSATDDLPVVLTDRLPLEPGVEALAFLSGNWAGGDANGEWESCYGSTRGGHLLSSSKELRDGRVVTFDYEHFYFRDGSVRMTPYPNGRASVEFTLAEFSGARRRAVFENPEHDFPWRFVYHRVDDASLVIELSGEMGGEAVEIRIDLKRQAD